MADFGTLGVQPETPESQVETSQSHKSFSVGTATALLALSLVAGQAGAETKNTNSPQTEAQPIVLAQAAETDGKTYIAEVVQIDGTKKKVEYTKKRGIIQPPAVTNGKLVDGSKATGDVAEDRASNRSILARYDEGSRVLLALLDKKDILGKASKDMRLVISKAQNNEPITRQEFLDGFTGIYILGGGEGEMSNAISGMATVGRVQLKLSPSEIASIKSEAERRANESLRRVSGGSTA